MAEPTGLEPATSDVTGRRSNQLNYDSALKFKLRCCFAPAAMGSQLIMGDTGLEPVTPGL